jgi:ubiquitin carboxyl-terminal hydrolase L5
MAELTRSPGGLSQPIYGLIFLFRWREDDAEKQEASCPDGLWFANQVSEERKNMTLFLWGY